MDGVPLEDVQHVLSNQYTGFNQRERLIIRDAQAWSQFWSQAHRTVMPQPPLPAIDFAQNVVIAATMGTRPNGGHSVQIEQVFEADGDLFVVVAERSPGANCVTTAAITAPAAAARIPRTSGTVSFIERRETFDC